jgi:hypothetical protein
MHRRKRRPDARTLRRTALPFRWPLTPGRIFPDSRSLIPDPLPFALNQTYDSNKRLTTDGETGDEG